MNKEILTIIKDYKNSLDGEPWFGRSVYSLLNDIDAGKAFMKPNDSEHSLIDILYHMLTWAEFTLKRVEKDKINDMKAFEMMDWREIDPEIHGWKKGIAEFKNAHKKLLSTLKSKEDSFLDEKVDYREYNFRYLLKGLLEHNIYHAGQIAYLGKLLS